MQTLVRPEVSLGAILGYTFLAFFIGVIFTPLFHNLLIAFRVSKQLRLESVDGKSADVFLNLHHKKSGTPTMGGILIWVSIFLTVALSRVLSFYGTVDHSLLQRGQVYLPLFTLLAFGILGAFDDYLNVCGIGKKKGLDALPKLITLLLISSFAAWWFYARLGYDSVHIPFASMAGLPAEIHLGLWYLPFVVFVLIGTANAVNVTDGLDGLAGGLLIIAFSAFGIVAYVMDLLVLAAFCGVTVGAIAAFLWYNVPPALFFMGDTGSLALGGMLAVMAFMIDRVLILPLIGFVFVIEMLSVILQLTSKKYRKGKKIFKSAPIHHHFEALGWGESKVTMRFWIIGMFFAFLGALVGIYG